MTHVYERKVPCETCSEGGDPKCEHILRLTEYNTSCMTRIERIVNGRVEFDVTLTWDEAKALEEMLHAR